MHVKDLVSRAFDAAKEKGFWDDMEWDDTPVTTHFVSSRLALVHAEVSEALEAYRAEGMKEWKREDGKPEGIASELADIVIRVADLSGGLGVNLEGAIEEKMRFNNTRPRLHGKRF